MKKFLTVLLALSVVFTYSFSAVGTVFAAEEVPGAGTDTDYIKAAVKELIEDLEQKAASIKIADKYKESFGTNAVDIEISGEYYKATLADIVADYTKVIDLASKDDSVRLDNNNNLKEYSNVDDAKAAIQAVRVEYEIYNNRDLVLSPADIGTVEKIKALLFNGTRVADVNAEAVKIYAIKTWARALDSMKRDVNAELAKIDLSLYTNDVMDETNPYKTTYAQEAAKRKAYLEKVVADTTVTVEDTYDNNATAIATMYKEFEAKLVKATSYTNIDGEEVILTYKFKDLKTAEDLDAENTGDKAEIAANKAAVQASAAAALKDALDTYNNSNKADAAKAVYETAQKNVAAFVEIELFLAEKKNNKFKNTYDANIDFTEILKNYAKVEAEAATLKLMVEKDGTPAYIAAVIDKNLADVKEDVFAETKTVEEAKAYLKTDAKASNYDLAWEKEQLVAKIEKAMNDGLEADPGFYAPEAEKIKAKYAEIIEKVNAAADKDQFDDVNKTIYDFTTVKGSIKDKNGVNTDVAALLNTATMLTKVNKFVDYLNGDLKSWEDGYRPAATKADLAEYLAEAGARTNADVAAKYDEAEAYAKSLPTVGAKNAALEKAKALIKALPTPVVSLTDKAQIEEAYAAAKEAGIETDTTLVKYINYVKGLEQKAIDDAIKALPAKITSADKAAVKAIADMIEAYNDTEMYGGIPTASSVDTQLAAVKAADKAAVEAAISALSANPTKAEVEAVRALADAYTAEYRDALAGDKADDFVNIDKLVYAEAQVKANLIKAVESFKIKVTTKRYTGSKMRINWTATGDESAIDGYRIYYSTKKSNSGYKYLAKTTKKYINHTSIKKSVKKGTRVFYRVRAYVEIDGQRYFSDYSTVGNRIWK